MLKKLEELLLKGRTVFVRVDFNVPIVDGKITELHRIESTLPTLRFVLGKAKKILIASHLGRPGGRKDPRGSLAPIRGYLESALSRSVTLAPDCIGSEVEALVQNPAHKVILLENLRFHKEEEANDPAFARALAGLAEVYVNDAFGAAHRAHASIAGMVQFFREKGAGFLLQKELDYLGRVLSGPEKPFVTLLGGAKVSDKIGVIKNLLPKMTVLLVGGGMAYTFLKAKGVSIGKSLLEEDRIPLAAELLQEADRLGIPLVLPTDHVAAEDTQQSPVIVDQIPPSHKGFDIGPKTIARFDQEIRKARMVLWNGPVGLFEIEAFRHGTLAMARSLAGHNATTIVAGGDTVAAARLAHVEDKITHLSTGGGATLEFLEGRPLPGIQALQEDR